MTRAEQLESLGLKSATTPQRKPEKTARLVSMDAFRGMVMTLMLAEQMRLPEVARSFPTNPIWNVIAYNTQHVEWQGCSLHDLIQPAFSFLVGTALPFSIASRKRKGQTFPTDAGSHHLARRFCLSYWEFSCARCVRLKPTSHLRTPSPRSDWDTFFCFFWDSRGCERRSRAGADLICFWAAFAIYPAPGPQFDYTRVGCSAELGAQLHRVSVALEQEFQSFVGVRCLVLESFPAGASICLQRGRMVDAEFHSNAGHHDHGAARGRVAQG